MVTVCRGGLLVPDCATTDILPMRCSRGGAQTTEVIGTASAHKANGLGSSASLPHGPGRIDGAALAAAPPTHLTWARQQGATR